MPMLHFAFDKYITAVLQISTFIYFFFEDSFSYIKWLHCKKDYNFLIVHTPYLLDLDERLSQFGILILDLESCRLQLLKAGEDFFRFQKSRVDLVVISFVSGVSSHFPHILSFSFSSPLLKRVKALLA